MTSPPRCHMDTTISNRACHHTRLAATPAPIQSLAGIREQKQLHQRCRTTTMQYIYRANKPSLLHPGLDATSQGSRRYPISSHKHQTPFPPDEIRPRIAPAWHLWCRTKRGPQIEMAPPPVLLRTHRKGPNGTPSFLQHPSRPRWVLQRVR